MSKARSTGNISNIVKASVTGVTISDGTNDLLSISSDGNLSVVGNINASTLDGIDGVSFLQTGSFNTFSSSIDTTIKNKLNGDGVISGSVQVDITNTTGYSTLSGSIATTTSGLAGRITTVEGNYATTGSNIFVGNQVITGSICTNNSIVTTGQIVAQTINVQQVTSSIVYSCGSNIFGNNSGNIHQFTGSMLVTGSLCVVGAGSFTEAFNGSSATFSGTARFRGGNVADVNNVAVRIDNYKSLSFYNCAETGWAFTLGADQLNNGLIGTNNNLNFATSPSLNTRATITSTGIACFACQVCAPSFIGGTLSGTSSTISNAGTACTVTDVLTLSILQTGGSSVCAGAGILFTGNNGATVARIYSRGNMNFNNGSDLVFQTQTSAGGTPQCTMVINGGSQNVGIGTFNPGYKLDVCVNAAGDQVVARFNNSPGTGNEGAFIGFSTGYSGAVSLIGAKREGAENDASLIFAPMLNESCVERMRITSAGNVGIGTICPQTPLQILRDTTGNGTSIEESNMGFTVLSAAGQSKISIGASNAGNYGYIQVMQDATSWTNRNLTLQPRGGNVGIGTYTPTQGKLEVQQTTTTAALWVQTGGSTSASTIADFRTGTNLPALQILGNGASIFNGNVQIGTTNPFSSPRVDIRTSCPLTSAVGQPIFMGSNDVTGPLGIVVQHFCGHGVCRVDITSTRYGVSGNDLSLNVDSDNPNTGGGLYIKYRGNVGIGSSNPGSILTIRSGVANSVASPESQVTITNTTSGNYATLGFRSVDSDGDHGRAGITVSKDAGTISGKMHFVVRADAGNFSNPMTILSGGNVGINTPNPTRMLHVCGGSAVLRVGPDYPAVGAGGDRDYIDLIADGSNTKIISPNETFSILNPSGNIDIISQSSGGVRLTSGSTSWTAISSDRRKKKNFETTQGLTELLQIEPVKYHFIWDDDCIPKRMGFIAQNIQPLIPEMVVPNGEKAEDGSDYLTITPDYLLPILVKSIQEQQCTINTLKSCLGII